MFEILLPTFLLLIALVMIHAVFGTEIIKRGIIFTDLAIGQWAALGVAVSLLLFDGKLNYLFALLFALGSALMIAKVSHRPYKEASIGLIYALGFSLIFLVMNNSSHGVELFLKLTASDLLFTDLATTLYSILLYLVIAAVLTIAKRKMRATKRYETLFFILFSVTVTNSVQVAGVLVVFTLLIAPSYIALIFQKGLYFSWSIGAVTSFIAVFLSYTFDLPTGYMIIAILSSIALAALLIKGTNREYK